MTDARPADPDQTRRIEKVLERVEALPTLSSVAARLMSAGASEKADISQVVAIIESDPAMASRILGLCRRADRGLGDRVRTVRHAVVMLGLDAVRSAALSVSVYDLMSKEGQASREALDASLAQDAAAHASDIAFDRTGFWKHSVSVGCCAELLAMQHSRLGVSPEEAFLAGLLHDLGKLVLDLVLPKAYRQVVRLAESRAVDVREIEREVIGIDHHEAGVKIAERWGLPLAIREVIARHTTPLGEVPDSPHKGLIGLVSVSEAICRGLHLGFACDFGQPLDAVPLWKELKLSTKGADSIVQPLHTALGDRLKVLGLEDEIGSTLLLESLANANNRLARLNQSLHDRTRAYQAGARVHEQLAHFLTHIRGARSVPEALACVADSVTRTMGEPCPAGLYLPGTGEPWQFVRLGPGPVVASSMLMPVPPPRARIAWTNAPEPILPTLPALGLIPWLGALLKDMGDLRSFKAMPLLEPNETGQAALLITRASFEACGIPMAALAPLITAWCLTTRSHAQVEAFTRVSRHMTEAAHRSANLEHELETGRGLIHAGARAGDLMPALERQLDALRGHAGLLLGRARPQDESTLRTLAGGIEAMLEQIASLRRNDANEGVQVRTRGSNLPAA